MSETNYTPEEMAEALRAALMLTSRHTAPAATSITMARMAEKVATAFLQRDAEARAAEAERDEAKADAKSTFAALSCGAGRSRPCKVDEKEGTLDGDLGPCWEHHAWALEDRAIAAEQERSEARRIVEEATRAAGLSIINVRGLPSRVESLVWRVAELVARRAAAEGEVERLTKLVEVLRAHLKNRHNCDTTEEEPDYGF